MAVNLVKQFYKNVTKKQAELLILDFQCLIKKFEE
jgi:hypothetical protein